MTDIQNEQTPLTYETAVARLEEIVKQLESGTLPLDKSLTLYEEGVRLVRECSKQLNEAEQKVKILQRTAEGDIQPTDFVSTDGEL